MRNKEKILQEVHRRFPPVVGQDQVYDDLEDSLVKIEEEKDSVYHERNLLVSALSKFFPAYLSQHPEGESWDDEWRWIVFIELPTGQASWHIHESELSLFDHLDRQDNKWDGHTVEEKYERLTKLTVTDLSTRFDPRRTPLPEQDHRFRRGYEAALKELGVNHEEINNRLRRR